MGGAHNTLRLTLRFIRRAIYGKRWAPWVPLMLLLLVIAGVALAMLCLLGPIGLTVTASGGIVLRFLETGRAI